MAIQSSGLAYLATPTGWVPPSTPEWTVSFSLRIDAKGGTAKSQLVLSVNSGYFIWVSDNGDPNTFQVVFLQNSQAGSKWIPAAASGFPVGRPVHVTLCYSSITPSACFATVNGVEVRDPEWSDFVGNVDFRSSMTLFNVGGGDVQSHMTIENLLFLDRVLTDEERTNLHYDPFGTIPTLSATTKIYYPFTGTVGDDVATGDPGISISGDAARSLTVVPAAGGTFKYVDSFSYARPAEVGQLYVGTSGRTLTLACTWVDSGKPASFSAAAVAAMTNPVFKINGTAITGLGAPDALTVCHRPNLGGFFWMLPEGVTIAPTDVVTADAPDDWVVSTQGGCVGMTNRTVANRVGIPSAEPSDGLLRVGVQPTSGMATYWGSGPWQANAAKVCEFGLAADRWEDNHPKTPFNVPVVMHQANLGGDAVGYSPRAFVGKWAVAWESWDLENPFTDMGLSDYGGPCKVTELPAYATTENAGANQPNVKVFELAMISWTAVLSGDLDATATTIPITAALGPHWVGDPTAPALGILTIDGEDVLMGSYSGGAFVGCQRGFGGTTAASHSGGATIAVRNTSNSIGVSVYSNHAAGENRRFKNLRVYMPGEWVEPETPGPVVMGPEDHYQLNSFFKREFVDHGMGVVRFMETYDAMGDRITEVDDVSVPEDGFWNGSKRRLKWGFSGVKKFNPTGRFFYYNGEFQGTETYPATLAADIDATTTSVRITTTTGDRIPYGQTLFIGTERMRVRDPLPAVGSDVYTVVRGRMDTTAASHTAGSTVTVGWRKPITSADQYSIIDTLTNKSYHYCELMVDEANSLSPIRNGLLMLQGGGDTSNDINIQARRSLTLTAAFGAADLTMTVSTPSPGDWDWIQPKGYVHFNGETMVVKSTNSGAGTITVVGRDGSAGNLAIGATGTHTSGGVLFGNADGSVKVYGDMFTGAIPPVVVGPASAVMFIQADPDFESTNDSFAAVADQDFEVGAVAKPRAAVSVEGFTPSAYHPAAFHAHICALAGADAWANIPYTASDDFVYETAKTILDVLPPGRKLYISPGNEMWNFGFTSYTFPHSIAHTLGMVDGFAHYAMQVLHFGKIAKSHAAKIGREADVLATAEWQVGNLGVFPDRFAKLATAGFTLAPPLDRLADAPYFAPTQSPEFAAITAAAADSTQRIDLYQYDFEFSDYYAAGADSAIEVRDQLNATYGWNVERCHYEGDLGDFTQDPAAATNDERRILFHQCLDDINHPNHRHYQRSWWEILRRKNESDALATFCYSRPGDCDVPSYRNHRMWGLLWFIGHQPGRGDGTDGLTDNRQHLFSQGLPGSTDLLRDSPGQHTVSPRALAFQEYNDEFFGASSPPAATDFSDDFSGGGLTGWTNPSGRWSVVGGKATYDGSESGSPSADVLARLLPDGVGDRWVMGATIDAGTYADGVELGTGDSGGGYANGVSCQAYNAGGTTNWNVWHTWHSGNLWTSAVADSISPPLTSTVRLELWKTQPTFYALAVYPIVAGVVATTPSFVLEGDGTGVAACDSLCFRPVGSCTVDDVSVSATPPTRMLYIECEGYGYNAVAPLLGRSWLVHSIPVGGVSRVSSAVSAWATNTAVVLAAGPDIPITYLAQCGMQTLVDGWGDPWDGSSIENRKTVVFNHLTADMTTLIGLAKSVPKVDRVAVCTILPFDMSKAASNGLLGDQSGEVRQAAYDELRGRYKEWLLANQDTLGITVVDVAAVPEMSDVSNPTWYSNGTNPTGMAFDRLARAVVARLIDPPQVVTAAIPPEGTAVTIAFDRPIVLNVGPAAFTVTVAGSARPVSAATASGTTVSLTLASPIFSGQTVTVAAPAGGVKDADGLLADAFSTAAANGSTQTPAPTPIAVVSAATPPSGATVTITFDRPIVLNAPAAFSVTVAGAARAVTSATASGTTVSLTLASPIFTGQVVTVAATAGGVKDADGLLSNAFSVVAVNGSTVPNPGTHPHPGKPKPRPWPFGGSNARSARGYR